jgi:hypothetical protein
MMRSSTAIASAAGRAFQAADRAQAILEHCVAADIGR